jgi:hypothetical protein
MKHTYQFLIIPLCSKRECKKDKLYPTVPNKTDTIFMTTPLFAFFPAACTVRGAATMIEIASRVPSVSVFS